MLRAVNYLRRERARNNEADNLSTNENPDIFFGALEELPISYSVVQMLEFFQYERNQDKLNNL